MKTLDINTNEGWNELARSINGRALMERGIEVTEESLKMFTQQLHKLVEADNLINPPKPVEIAPIKQLHTTCSERTNSNKVNLSIVIPEESNNVYKQIKALEYALEQDYDEKTREIHRKALEGLKKAIEVKNGAYRH